jgi:polyketide cyclase/dehydrase/lipid transport protein
MAGTCGRRVLRIERCSIEHSVNVAASAEAVWQEVTQVDIASIRHPLYLSVLGIPKPLRAEVLRSGVGGARIAFFANNLRFSQEITEWQPSERYAFTFKPDPGFRVAYFLDLSDGPFRMVAGAYRISRTELGTRLSLSSQYELRGALGACLRSPVRLVLHLFQIYLLRGIRTNSERRAPAQN